MRHYLYFLLTLFMIGSTPWTSEAFQRGRGGGGMRGGGGRPVSAPQRSVPQRPMNVPQQRPNISVPNVQRPSTMPSPSTRPSTPPQVNRPSGGMVPSQRPSIGQGAPNRPTQLPSVGTGNRPTQLPSVSTPGGGLPTGNRPSQLPANRPNVGTNRPSTLPSTRPSTGELNDFLGITRPGAGGGGNVAPPIANRPNIDRPNVDRPINIQRPPMNNLIANRPSWSNIGNNRITQINNNWNTAINRPVMNNWVVNNPGRYQYWHGWGFGVASQLPVHYPGYRGWFNHGWWNGHYHPCAGWHYWHAFGRYPYSYWWTVPVWSTLTRWVGYAASASPVYYDYGSEGNIVYQDNSVYIGGQQVATQEEFSESAAALATVPPPPSDAEAEKAEWMPLGTFVVSKDKADTKPSWSVQLAVNKAGIISGTLYNLQTDQAQTIQGKVDKETQRVAFRIGDNTDIVVETGLYNLTQDEVPILIHFGKTKTETYLMVRIKQEEQSETGSGN